MSAGSPRDAQINSVADRSAAEEERPKSISPRVKCTRLRRASSFALQFVLVFKSGESRKSPIMLEMNGRRRASPQQEQDPGCAARPERPRPFPPQWSWYAASRIKMLHDITLAEPTISTIIVSPMARQKPSTVAGQKRRYRRRQHNRNAGLPRDAPSASAACVYARRHLVSASSADGKVTGMTAQTGDAGHKGI